MIKGFFNTPLLTNVHPDYISEISKELKNFEKIEDNQFEDFKAKHYSISIDGN